MEEKVSDNQETVRESVFILGLKIFVVLVLFEGIYTVLFAALNLAISIPFDLHHHLSVLFVVLSLTKIILELWFILYILLSWSSSSYLITNKHILRRKGIFSSQEEVYHFDTIRSISLEQSFLGKLFNFGDIVLKISASGGYQGDINLTGIENPRKYETLLKALF